MTFRTTNQLLVGAALLTFATSGQAGPRERTREQAPITFGQTVTGALTTTTPTCSAELPNGKTYSFAAEADTRIEITMSADDFDTMVEVGRMVDCQFVSLGSNDDGSGPEDGLNSRLTGRLPETGTYIIRAQSFGEGGAGQYSLTLNRLPPLRGAPEPIALTVGQSVSGKLGPEDATIADSGIYGLYNEYGEEAGASIIESGRPYHFYSLTGNAGDEFLIKLDSEEFDPMLDVGVQSPLGFSVAQSNDDGGGEDDGLNSRLTVTFQSAGTLMIRVSPLTVDTGDYSIVVVPAPAEGEEPAAADATAQEVAADVAASAADAASAAADAAADAAAAAVAKM